MSEKKIKIFEGDCLKVMKKMEDCSYTSILSDVPYGLSFMGKKWDYDVPSVEVFEEMLRVTQHGGYLFCFGGSRTFHRIACNIEDAGWVLKDTIMWLYGSGFPKSHNISKAIDKKYGLEREKVGEIKGNPHRGKVNCMQGGDFGSQYYETKASHNLAKDFEGYGTALKPAYEPIIIAHKPCEGSYVDNVEKHGIAGLNIEDCRVGNADTRSKTSLSALGQNSGWNNHKNRVVMAGSSNGRFPANVITDGSEEVCNVMDEQSGISKSSGGRIGNAQGSYSNLGQTGFSTNYEKGQSGLGDVGGASRFFAKTPYSEKEIEPAYEPIIIAHKPNDGSYVDNVEKHGIGGLNIEDCRVGSGLHDKREEYIPNNKNNVYAKGMGGGVWNNTNGRFPANVITDGSEEVCGTMDEQSGTVRQPTGKSIYPTEGNISVVWNNNNVKDTTVRGFNDVGGASRFFYCAKASKKEKNEGLDRLQPQQRDSSRNEDQPSMNGGKGNPYNRGAKKVQNPHPTVKPIALMEYLAKMLTQPNGRTKILDPYMGSGTTLIACKKLGNIECHGIEMNPEYVKVAKARLGEDLSEYDVFDNTKEKKKTNKQMTIWDILNEQ